MENIGKWYIYLLCCLLYSGCDFGDTNVDPTTLPDVDVQLLLPAAQAQTASNLASIGLRVTGSVIQHFEGIEAQPEGYSTYLIDENTLNDFWRTGLYAAALRDCHLIIEKAKDRSPHYAGIAKVLIAINLGVATTFWGDVPYSEAFVPQNYRPKYDTQEQIYQHIHRVLDGAIQDFSAAPGSRPPEKDDLIFGGNTEYWSQVARALKARYYMHLTKKDPEASAKALHVLADVSALTDKSTPLFPYEDNENEAHPLAKFGNDRPNQLALGNKILSMLLELNDPRLTVYGVLSSGSYLLYKKGNRNLFWGRFDAQLPFISETELLFIKAEASLREGDEATAFQSYEKAIKSSMASYAISDLESTNYLNTIDQWASFGSFEQKLNAIIEQKYIALFVQGTIESWVDYRRTGYPELAIPFDANESLNPSKTIPKRYLYPLSERNTNTEQMNLAIERQNGHLLDVDLWAFR